MAINFFDYVSKYDFVPFAKLVSNEDFKIISTNKTDLIAKAIKDTYKAKSDVRIEFTAEILKKEKTILKFKLHEAHQYASDPDGYIMYKLTAISGQEFVSNHQKVIEHDLGIKKYEDVIEIEFTKNLMQTVQFIDFYFKDNSLDWLDLQGGMPNKWEHCGRVSIGAASSCYCNRDFTEEEVKKIVTQLRDNTFYGEKSISYHHKDKLFYLENDLPVTDKTFQKFTEVLNKTFFKYEINTCLKKRHFLAQVYSETQYFTRTKEVGKNLIYDPYRGRGFIQLTAAHAKNGSWVAGTEDSRTHNKTSYLGYKEFSKIDVVTNPDLISNSLTLSADSGGWFWKYGKMLEDGSILNMNNAVQIDNIERVSKLVNGGKEALIQRIEAFNVLNKIFSNEKCINKK